MRSAVSRDCKRAASFVQQQQQQQQQGEMGGWVGGRGGQGWLISISGAFSRDACIRNEARPYMGQRPGRPNRQRRQVHQRPDCYSFAFLGRFSLSLSLSLSLSFSLSLSLSSHFVSASFSFRILLLTRSVSSSFEVHCVP